MTRAVSPGVFAAAAIALPLSVSASEATESATGIETIIVTATKREESIQDVPIAVSAIAGEDLAARGAQDIYGLMEVAPSVVVYNSNSTSNGGTLRIRGVGTTGNNPGLEAAVGTFIDGVYRSRAGLAFNDLTDLDRVEILRGPQGTLFGKNTVAGAVSIVTRKPEFDNTFSLSAGLGNLESRELGLIGNAVLSDDVLAGRLSIAHRQRDGFYENVDTDAAYDNRDRRSVRAQLLWTPSADVDVRVILDDTNKDEDCCPAAFWITGPTSPVVAALGGDITPFAVDDASMVGVNSEPFEDVSDSGQSVDVTWRMPQGATFRSISALRDFEVVAGPGRRLHERRHRRADEYRRVVPELLAGASNSMARTDGSRGSSAPTSTPRNWSRTRSSASLRTGRPTSRRSSAPRRSRRSSTATPPDAASRGRATTRSTSPTPRAGRCSRTTCGR